MGFRLFISLFLFMDVLWLWLADRRLRAWAAGRAGGGRRWVRAARVALVVMVAAQFLSLAVWFLPAEWSRGVQRDMPRMLVQAMFIWHLVVLPAGVVLFTLEELGAAAVQRFRRWRRPTDESRELGDTAEETAVNGEGELVMSRRQWLGLSLAATPPALLTLGSGAATQQLGQFVVTRKDVPVPGLPDELIGATIAHVSDTHVGRFTDDEFLARVAERTNAIDAEMVLFTGDLIDFSLRDLPPALEMCRLLRPRGAMAFCIGNHDMIDSPDEFVRRTRAAGVPMIVDDFTCVTLRGRRVRLLGSPWQRGESGVARAVGELRSRLDPEAFHILLAHHPHAFDYAADLGIPLTLAGHTHGGQLMLGQRLGPGPLMYRYWSGIYRKPAGTLHVSNGVGNWFPLRVNAPAEISLLTLRQA